MIPEAFITRWNALVSEITAAPHHATLDSLKPLPLTVRVWNMNDYFLPLKCYYMQHTDKGDGHEPGSLLAPFATAIHTTVDELLKKMEAEELAGTLTPLSERDYLVSALELLDQVKHVMRQSHAAVAAFRVLESVYPRCKRLWIDGNDVLPLRAFFSVIHGLDLRTEAQNEFVVRIMIECMTRAIEVWKAGNDPDVATRRHVMWCVYGVRMEPPREDPAHLGRAWGSHTEANGPHHLVLLQLVPMILEMGTARSLHETYQAGYFVCSILRMLPDLSQCFTPEEFEESADLLGSFVDANITSESWVLRLAAAEVANVEVIITPERMRLVANQLSNDPCREVREACAMSVKYMSTGTPDFMDTHTTLSLFNGVVPADTAWFDDHPIVIGNIMMSIWETHGKITDVGRILPAILRYVGFEDPDWWNTCDETGTAIQYSARHFTPEQLDMVFKAAWQAWQRHKGILKTDLAPTPLRNLCLDVIEGVGIHWDASLLPDLQRFLSETRPSGRRPRYLMPLASTLQIFRIRWRAEEHHIALLSVAEDVVTAVSLRSTKDLVDLLHTCNLPGTVEGLPFLPDRPDFLRAFRESGCRILMACLEALGRGSDLLENTVIDLSQAIFNFPGVANEELAWLQPFITRMTEVLTTESCGYGHLRTLIEFRQFAARKAAHRAELRQYAASWLESVANFLRRQLAVDAGNVQREVCLDTYFCLDSMMMEFGAAEFAATLIPAVGALCDAVTLFLIAFPSTDSFDEGGQQAVRCLLEAHGDRRGQWDAAVLRANVHTFLGLRGFASMWDLEARLRDHFPEQFENVPQAPSDGRSDSDSGSLSDDNTVPQ